VHARWLKGKKNGATKNENTAHIKKIWLKEVCAKLGRTEGYLKIVYALSLGFKIMIKGEPLLRRLTALIMGSEQ